jgi:uncharacterized membrane protein
MEDRNQAIRELHEKIEALASKHKDVYEEIRKLQNAIFELDLSDRTEIKSAIQQPVPERPTARTIIEEIKNPVSAPPQQAPVTPPVQKEVIQPRPRKKERTPIEEFIGTNLLNKIGIVVLVIGIGFGTKYSIDHNLINPLTRIVLGYLSGIALIMVAIRLKKAHENFSAVLLSGGIAVLYFITFAAYDIYELIPQPMAFALMVIFTAFTVFAALQYDKEVIGIIGLVGAYAVPFLLSDGSGRVVILFSYITIINTGILILAFKKYWKRLYYLAFILTWLTYAVWYTTSFNEQEHIWISLGFGTVFFFTFYVTFLSYKLVRKEALSKPDLVFMLLNSFVYYSYGYMTIDILEGGGEFLGLFTLFTAVVHFTACLIVYKQQSQFKDVFYFLAGMVLVFLTLAVPVQLEGNWVTIVWAFEAALLFWIGRTKSFPVYEKLSYPMIILAFGSLVHDWDKVYHNIYDYTYDQAIPHLNLFLNVYFLTTVLVTASFGFIFWLSRRPEYPSPLQSNIIAQRAFSWGLPLLLIVALYTGIFREIETFWSQEYALSKVSIRSAYNDVYDQFDEDLQRFSTIWLINFSAIFALVLSIIQLRFVKDRNLMVFCLVANALVIFSFLTAGLYELASLRSSFLNDAANKYYIRDLGHILIRYAGIVLIIPLMIINYRFMRNDLFKDSMRQAERVLFHAAVLVLLSSELVHWLDMGRIENSFKLSLSILWGAYALFLIILGLWKDLKYIRISAIVLFAVTLIKLFVYDMEDMSTIAKTIVMMILGVLMLTASFLYNKYKRSTRNEIQ